MHNAVQNMLDKYQCVTLDDYRNALKEIIQEIALLGLYRAKFFDKAAFYGGTALRMIYGLDRFSEDIDFSLLQTDHHFELRPYSRFLEEELQAFGFEAEITQKAKTADTPIESAFIKTNTQMHLLKIGLTGMQVEQVHPGETLKIKVEVDTWPPSPAETEIKYQLLPIPYHVRIFTMPVLMAGKLHALLCRQWGGNRVKGRDLYDYVWFISREVPVDLQHLESRMRQTGHIDTAKPLTADSLRTMLVEKFGIIDFRQASNDVMPFIGDINTINIWSEDFFTTITRKKLLIK